MSIESLLASSSDTFAKRNERALRKFEFQKSSIINPQKILSTNIIDKFMKQRHSSLPQATTELASHLDHSFVTWVIRICTNKLSILSPNGNEVEVGKPLSELTEFDTRDWVETFESSTNRFSKNHKALDEIDYKKFGFVKENDTWAIPKIAIYQV